MDYRDYIMLEPGKRGGRPCIRGLRMTVHDVLEYLAAGMTSEEIVSDFPNLTLDDVRACLAYAEALVAGAEVMPAPKPRSRARRRSQPTT